MYNQLKSGVCTRDSSLPEPTSHVPSQNELECHVRLQIIILCEFLCLFELQQSGNRVMIIAESPELHSLFYLIFSHPSHHMQNNVALLYDNFEWNSHAFMIKFRSRDFSLPAIDTLKNSAHFSSPLFRLICARLFAVLSLLLLQWAPSERDPAIKTSTAQPGLLCTLLIFNPSKRELN